MNYNQKLRLKVKFFRLTIKSGFLYDTHIWQMRDKPLTEDEVDSFFHTKKNKFSQKNTCPDNNYQSVSIDKPKKVTKTPEIKEEENVQGDDEEGYTITH